MSASRLDMTNLWRALLEPEHPHEPWRTVFIRAPDKTRAQSRIAAVLAALDERPTWAIAGRLRFALSAPDCIHFGWHPDLDSRLFLLSTEPHELRALGWVVPHPLFLVREPRDLLLKWAQVHARQAIASESPGADGGRAERGGSRH